MCIRDRYVPVVNPKEFDVAIAYLIRRLEENASSENFMSGIFDLATDESIFKREAVSYTHLDVYKRQARGWVVG